MKQWTHPCQILTVTWLYLSFSCFPSSEHLERTGGSTRKEWRQAERDRGRLQLQNRGWSISDAICPPHYFRIRWSPSPNSSGERETKRNEVRSSLNPCEISIYRALLLVKWQWERLLVHYELTFDCADQKTALVRQVVNHLEDKTHIFQKGTNQTRRSLML